MIKVMDKRAEVAPSIWSWGIGSGIAVLSLVLTGHTHAAEWRSDGGVRVGAGFSDNICLQSRNEESKGFGTVTPDLRVTGNGGRANLDMLLSIQYNTLADNPADCSSSDALGEKDAIAPRLRLNGDAELIEQWLFFDARASIIQNSVNPFQPGGGTEVNGRANTNTSYNYSLSPYINRRLGEDYTYSLRYTYDEQINTEDLIGDSNSDNVRFEIGSSPATSRFSMGLIANYDETHFEATPNRQSSTSELINARIRAAWAINNTWEVNGSAGQEWNDFVSQFDDTDGSFWDVGVKFTPNSRVTVEVGTGDRFYGTVPRVDVNYRHKRSNFTASYTKMLTYSRRIRGGSQESTDIDELVDSTVPESEETLDFAESPTTITGNPIVDERLTMKYAFNGRRTSLRFNSTFSEQLRAEDGRESTFLRASAILTRSLSRSLSVNSLLSWDEREGDEQIDQFQSDSETWRLGFGASYKLGENTTTALNYTYTDRDAKEGTGDYTENRVDLTLRHAF